MDVLADLDLHAAKVILWGNKYRKHESSGAVFTMHLQLGLVCKNQKHLFVEGGFSIVTVTFLDVALI